MVKLFYLSSESLAVINSGFTDQMWQTKSKSRNKLVFFFKLKKLWLFTSWKNVKLDKSKNIVIWT